MFIFSIPDSHALRMVNGILLCIMEQHPDWLQKDTIIETAYGCPPHCLWNGNRSFGGVQYDCREWAKNVLTRYYHHHIQYRLTFTNFLLKEADLSDEYGNDIASTVNFFGGYVMVSTPMMAQYMTHYPKLQLCWSTTTDFGDTPEKEIATINQLSEKHLVVPPYTYNNTEYLKKFQHPENIEVLVNEHCIDNCPRRREHWTRVNQQTIEYKTTIFSPDYTDCFYPELYNNPKLPRHHTITRNKLQEYADMGINHFKISGRMDDQQSWQAYMDYLIHPDYWQQAEDFSNLYAAWALGKTDKPPF